MKAYINMIVKKRCSVKSVSSYGTNWIRWCIGGFAVWFLEWRFIDLSHEATRTLSIQEEIFLHRLENACFFSFVFLLDLPSVASFLTVSKYLPCSSWLHWSFPHSTHKRNVCIFVVLFFQVLVKLLPQLEMFSLPNYKKKKKNSHKHVLRRYLRKCCTLTELAPLMFVFFW